MENFARALQPRQPRQPRQPMTPSREVERARIEIRGLVQGVGFRPFVYRLATETDLTGWIRNDVRGVLIEVEGPAGAIELFKSRIGAECPPRAVIHSVTATPLTPTGTAGFEIRRSEAAGGLSVPVPPDVAVCADCLAETLDPADRRHSYPFTNCTNCGPRFSIVGALPYDRPNTTMRGFEMCPACAAEYGDPRDRRFHAQPNACPACGPGIELWAPDGARLAAGGRALLEAAAALGSGRILAVKGLGGFHLMADARNREALSRLRRTKSRRAKPFALMVRDLAMARLLCEIPRGGEALLSSPEAPIVLMRRRDGSGVSDEVAPGNPHLGVMLPPTPLHHLLMRETGYPVVATSGNLSDEPICTDEREALVRLGGIAELFLVHDRPIERHVDDSVGWILRDEPRLLRRARGYAPAPVLVRADLPPILAVGGHLKNTIALGIADKVFVSQHIGDLETPAALDAFERVIFDFLRLYGASPVVIAHDLHPDYLSTRWATGAAGGTRPADVAGSRSLDEAAGRRALEGAALVPVQHHHAHLSSCLAENGIEGPALGVIWDGTGYGPDGTIWGGEFLAGDAAGFERVAHLRPFRLPGGDTAAREPRRSAFAVLWELLGDGAAGREDLAPVRALAAGERDVLGRMMTQGVNAPITTSAGRLFDAAAALLGLQQVCSFEGQAAMALEYGADPAVSEGYPLDQSGGGEAPLVLDWRGMFEALLMDLRRGVATGTIAARFQNGLVEGIASIALAAGLPRVALSGGCFQNRWMTERVSGRLERSGFEVLLHGRVPPNDGGISLGQVAVAAASLAAAGGAGN